MEPYSPGQAVLTEHRRERITKLSPSPIARNAFIKGNRRIDVIQALCCDRYQLLTGKQFWDGCFKFCRRTRQRSAGGLRPKRNDARHHLNKQKKGAGTHNRSRDQFLRYGRLVFTGHERRNHWAGIEETSRTPGASRYRYENILSDRNQSERPGYVEKARPARDRCEPSASRPRLPRSLPDPPIRPFNADGRNAGGAN